MTSYARLTLACACTALVGSAAPAWALTGDEILQKMDENMTFKSRIANGTMTIHRPGQSDEVKSLRMWTRGWDDSYSEFLAPARDKGIKYLKLKDNLYMYLPRTEKVVKISGHLLRQSLMDSDFSYEDMLEARALLADYQVRIDKEETLDGQPCWVLELTAKRPGLAYYRRRLWVAKTTFVSVRAERYAQSGVLLRVMTTAKPVTYGGRHYPTVMTMQDKLKKGTSTTLELTNIKFDADIPGSLFSRRNLMKRD